MKNGTDPFDLEFFVCLVWVEAACLFTASEIDPDPQHFDAVDVGDERVVVGDGEPEFRFVGAFW